DSEGRLAGRHHYGDDGNQALIYRVGDLVQADAILAIRVGEVARAAYCVGCEKCDHDVRLAQRVPDRLRPALPDPNSLRVLPDLISIPREGFANPLGSHGRVAMGIAEEDSGPVSSCLHERIVTARGPGDFALIILLAIVTASWRSGQTLSIARASRQQGFP